MRLIRSLWAASIVLLLGVQSAAADAPLSGRDVERFIASFSDMRAVGEKYDAGLASDDPTNPLAGFLAAVTGSVARSEVEAVVRKHGFASLGEWSDVASRTMRAFVAVNYGAAMEDVQAQMQEARKEVEANDSLTAEQKQMILQQMQAPVQMASMINAPPEDQATVAPYAERLQALFGEE